MKRKRSEFFSLHDLLTMAALAALGGVSGAVVSIIRAAVHAIVVLPGGMQFLAGIHVLWLILAVGLVRRPGAATLPGLRHFSLTPREDQAKREARGHAGNKGRTQVNQGHILGQLPDEGISNGICPESCKDSQSHQGRN